jgi:hypothetical protein
MVTGEGSVWGAGGVGSVAGEGSARDRGWAGPAAGACKAIIFVLSWHPNQYPMKILTLLLTGSILLSAGVTGHAQPDTAKITQKALSFADSLVKTDAFETWSTYADLCPASVIKFYGGKDGFIEHVKTLRKRTFSDLAEDAPELKMLNLMTQNDQWQCVIRMSRYFHKEDKKFHLTTYFIGQSKDEGETWRLFDVNYNKVANIIYMFPDIFGDMPIQESTIMTPEQELAAQQKAAAEASASTGKKAATRKK